MEKLELKYEAFSKALFRLKEAIDLYEKEENAVLLDGTIQRFEFTIELAWKLLKEYLSYEKLGDFNSPRATVKESYKQGIISDGETWLDMLDDRNLTSHTYDEETAEEIYKNIVSKYYNILKQLKEKMGSVISNEK